MPLQLLIAIRLGLLEQQQGTRPWTGLGHLSSSWALTWAFKCHSPYWTGLLEQWQSTHPGIQMPMVARAVAINGTCMLVSVFTSQPAWWGEHK